MMKEKHKNQTQTHTHKKRKKSIKMIIKNTKKKIIIIINGRHLKKK